MLRYSIASTACDVLCLDSLSRTYIGVAYGLQVPMPAFSSTSLA
jgi:hypothetical protein